MEKIPTAMRVVAAALRAESGAWLMYQRPEGKHHAGLWEFPGGKIDSRETSEIALIRELREELAIEVREEDLSFTGSASQVPSADQPAIVIELYTCCTWLGEPDPQEGGAIAWLGFDAMANLPKPPLDESLLEQLMQKHEC